MSSFHNTGDVGNQAGSQIFHGNVNFITNPLGSNPRLVLDSYDATAESHSKLDHAILESLAFPDMFDRINNVEAHLRHTCEWIFDVEEYRNWKNNSSGLLWIKGNPGAGKSTLMSQLYRRTSLEHPTDKSLVLAFFFYAPGKSLQYTPLGMVRSLLFQILQSDPKTRKIFKKAYEARDASFGQQKRTWEWQLPELNSLLSDVILSSARNQQVTIFIDALDEAGEQDAAEIATFFYRIHESIVEASVAAKICISCRHYPVLTRDRSVEIHVEKYNGEDIIAYVRKFFSPDAIPNLSSDARAQWTDLQQYLVEGAKGIFQWVRLMVPIVKKRLADGISWKKTLQWLHRVPPGLKEVYTHILRNVVDVEYRVDSYRLFKWVCLAIRPLSITELRYALVAHQISLSPQLTCEDSEEFMSTDEELKPLIVSWSGGLLEVTKTEKDESLIVQVIHHSVNDFFLAHGFALLDTLVHSEDQHLSVQPTLSSGIETIENHHGHLYWCCLTYVALVHSQEQSREQSKTSENELEKNSGAESQLPAKFEKELVLKHESSENQEQSREELNTEELEPDPEISSQGSSFFDKSDSSDYDNEDPRNASYWPLRRRLPLIVYASSCILEHARRAGSHRSGDIAMEAQLLNEVAHNWFYSGGSLITHDLDFVYGWTALHVAAIADLTDLAQYIVKTDIEIDVQPEMDGPTPLVIAAYQGHLTMATILITAGALNLTSPMIVASRKGHLNVVRLLIKSGADVNAFVDGETALLTASEEGHNSIVRSLIDAGANLNTRGGTFATALSVAAAKGGKETVQLLIEAGAKVNNPAEEDDGGALLRASERGHMEIVQVLVKAGADVNVEKESRFPALFWAILAQSHTTVQLLIEAGANVNAQGQQYGSCLYAAAAANDGRAVRLLLEAGADVNGQGGNRGTALWAASRQGYEDIVRTLIEAGADVNGETGEEGMTILTEVSSRGHKNVIQLLIAAGADLDAPSKPYGTALQAALTKGYKSIAKILVEAGAVENK